MAYYPEVPKKIVEVLARTLVALTPRPGSSSSAPASDDERRLLLSLLFCLGEWAMRMPSYLLTQPQEDGRGLLHHVFSALQGAAGDPAGGGGGGVGGTPSPVGAAPVERREGKQFEGFPSSTKQVTEIKLKSCDLCYLFTTDLSTDVHRLPVRPLPRSHGVRLRP